MSDKDAAHITPGSGNMSALNALSSNDSQGRVVTQVAQHPQEDSPPLFHILIVEDDSSLAKLEAGVLTARGYAVTVVDDGELAVTAFRQSMPDLVVLDIDLPGALSGWDVLDILRSSTSIPVLLTSAETAVHKHIRSSSESRLTLNYLPKPYPIQALLKCVERMLQGGTYGPHGRS